MTNLKVRSARYLISELEDFPPDAPVVEESQETVTDTVATADSPATDIPIDEPKRKRGKRKVLRKTTKRDEKGYLVTKNEYVYESFSEDEESDVPKVKKQVPTKAPTSAAGDKKKGKANAAGQKNLMSFFGKK
jgi:DNA polymerase delta subunit 3